MKDLRISLCGLTLAVALVAAPAIAAPPAQVPSTYEVQAQVEALREAASALKALADRPTPEGTEATALADDQEKLRVMAARLSERAGEMKKLLARKGEWDDVSEQVITVLITMDDALDEISTDLETAKEEAPSESQKSFAAEAYAILEHL